MANVILAPLEEADRNQFILDNQEAFRYGAMEEFGLRDDHFEEDGEIISRQTIEASIDGGTAYRIVQNGETVGGVVVKVEGTQGDLELLFVAPGVHSKGSVMRHGGQSKHCTRKWKSGRPARPILKSEIFISM